jgi:hypothetical protein
MVLAGCVEGFLLLAALVCSSFSAVNLGTSKRSVLISEGDERVDSKDWDLKHGALHSVLFKFLPLYEGSCPQNVTCNNVQDLPFIGPSCSHAIMVYFGEPCYVNDRSPPTYITVGGHAQKDRAESALLRDATRT